MESESRISRAKQLLRRFNFQRGKRGRRVHEYVYEDNGDRLRALDGICGHCRYLKLQFKHIDGKETAILFCKKNHNPLQLYQNTPLGHSANCPGFVPKSEISPNGVK